MLQRMAAQTFGAMKTGDALVKFIIHTALSGFANLAFGIKHSTTYQAFALGFGAGEVTAAILHVERALVHGRATLLSR